MKISKEARRAARKLFRECFVQGRMDESRIRALVSALATQKPRHFLGILTSLEKLVKHDLDQRALLVETPIACDEPRLREIEAQVQRRFTAPLIMRHQVNPALIGGMRIKVGSDVWDGSIAARLNQLEVKN